MDWFLYDNSLRHERVNIFPAFTYKNQNCTENQSIHLFPLYFGVFSCRCETCPIDFISLSKSLRCESCPI